MPRVTMYITIAKPGPRCCPMGRLDDSIVLIQFLLSLSCRGLRGFHSARALAVPVAVERSLDLHEPDDRAGDRQQGPEARQAGHRLLAPVVRIKVPDLGARDERDRDRAADEHQDDRESAADPLSVAVELQLFEGLVRPVV